MTGNYTYLEVMELLFHKRFQSDRELVELLFRQSHVLVVIEQLVERLKPVEIMFPGGRSEAFFEVLLVVDHMRSDCRVGQTQDRVAVNVFKRLKEEDGGLGLHHLSSAFEVEVDANRTKGHPVHQAVVVKGYERVNRCIHKASRVRM